jgi:hypothetical protein
MTPADEAEFIQLWNQGASYKAIAQAQRRPLGTVASRAAALVAQGKIQPRPRGADGPRPSRATHPHPRVHPHPHPRTQLSPLATPPRSPSWPSQKSEN